MTQCAGAVWTPRGSLGGEGGWSAGAEVPPAAAHWAGGQWQADGQSLLKTGSVEQT